MNIQKTLSGAALTVALEGRLDTTTAPKLEEELRDGITRLVFDVEMYALSDFLIMVFVMVSEAVT